MTDTLILHLERGRVWNTADLPEYSIALDGAVKGPYIDIQKHIYSFDHHENCIRHITNASCVQVMEALMLGFEPQGYNIFINDVDADTVLAFFLLKYPDSISNKFLVNLVNIVGKIDALGPAYPLFSEEHQIYNSFNNKVMHKYLELKETGEYINYDLNVLLEECCNNLIQWLTSPNLVNIEKQDSHFELYPDTNNTNWIMVSGDYFLFGELYKKGYKRIIVWKLLPNNSYAYTIAKKSEFVDWDINKIINGLNEIESGWGGGSTIAGSPRNADGTRSSILPEQLIKIINNILDS